MDPDSYLLTILTSIEVLPVTSGSIFALVMALICLGFSGFISAAEIAFHTLTPQEKTEVETEEKIQDILIQKLLARSEYLSTTILIVNNLINIAVIILCNFFFSQVFRFGNTAISLLLQVVILTILLLLFGEIMPKIYARHNALKIARKAAITLAYLEKIFHWLSWILIKSSQLINKYISRKNTNISMNELSQALEMTQVDESEEKEMLEEIIKFGGKTVEEIMTSRIDMTDIDIRIDFESLIKIVIETGYSRLPVYENSQDNIKGIIYIKDLLPHIKEKDFDWTSLLRPAYFVPETKMIDDLLEEFRKQKIHMAIVVDEFGGTSGIVTMEDILEEIVGEISDEYDEEERQYVKIDENTYIFEGKTQLNDFYKITGTDESDFEKISEDAETLAGLILEIKEDFPATKEKITYGKYQFTILEADKRRIIKIKVKIDREEKE